LLNLLKTLLKTFVAKLISCMYNFNFNISFAHKEKFIKKLTRTILRLFVNLGHIFQTTKTKCFADQRANKHPEYKYPSPSMLLHF